MNVTGIKAGQKLNVAAEHRLEQAPSHSCPREHQISAPERELGFGERLSICGQFGINKDGSWRTLAPGECVKREASMPGMDASGKHITVQKLV